jgi:hypothetical protein
LIGGQSPENLDDSGPGFRAFLHRPDAGMPDDEPSTLRRFWFRTKTLAARQANLAHEKDIIRHDQTYLSKYGKILCHTSMQIKMAIATGRKNQTIQPQTEN